MNRDNPLIISDETLYKKVFKYDTSLADSRFFRQAIVDFLKGNEGKSFSNYMFHAVWERNEQGKTLKYCYFDEHQQRVKLDHYFYEWMKRTIRRVETILKAISDQNPERNASQRKSNQGTEPL